MSETKIVPSRKKHGGRKKGTPNKATADIRALAALHGPTALAELARLAVEADNEQARISACKEILDRAYGRSAQTMEVTGKDGGAIAFDDINEMEMARRVAFLLTAGSDYAIQ